MLKFRFINEIILEIKEIVKYCYNGKLIKILLSSGFFFLIGIFLLIFTNSDYIGRVFNTDSAVMIDMFGRVGFYLCMVLSFPLIIVLIFLFILVLIVLSRHLVFLPMIKFGSYLEKLILKR